MKVLFLCQRMVFEVNEKNKSRTTGYSYMVRDIAEYVSNEGVSVELLAISDERNVKHYKSIPVMIRTCKDIIFNFRLHYLFQAFSVLKKYKPSFRMALTIIYYYLSNGWVEKVIQKGNYDVIHIHGLGYGGKAYVDCCEYLRKKYILTFHALVSFSDEMKKSEGEKRLERDFLSAVKHKDIRLTAISTGMMNKIKAFLGVSEDDNRFITILNGTDIQSKYSYDVNIRDKYGIPADRKIILSVGNVSHGKNQMQIVNAVNTLPQSIRDNLCVLFIGQDRLEGRLSLEIEKLDLTEAFRVCGNINRDCLASYYGQGDYTIMASIAEGFGLAVIEGFVHGLPNLAFQDLEAVEDLYDEKAMLLVETRTDEALANGLTTMMEKTWDREYIKKYAHHFSLENVANRYKKLYFKPEGSNNDYSC